MKVQELMTQVDVNRVVDAFLLIDYSFSESNYESTLIEKYECIPKLRKIIEENIRLFKTCIPDKDTKPSTIFIMYVQDKESFEDSDKKTLSSFATDDEEVLAVIDKDFHLFDSLGEANVTHYCYDHVSINEMANYVIAEASIKELGKEICAAHLLSNMFFWGLFPEERAKRVNDLNKSLEQTITEEDVEASKNFKEAIKSYKDSFLQEMSVDQREYYLAKEKFQNDTEEIRMRYMQQVIEEIHKLYIDTIKQEYKSR